MLTLILGTALACPPQLFSQQTFTLPPQIVGFQPIYSAPQTFSVQTFAYPQVQSACASGQCGRSFGGFDFGARRSGFNLDIGVGRRSSVRESFKERSRVRIKAR